MNPNSTNDLASLYRRVSTNRQDLSLQAQEERVADYLRFKRLTAEAEFSDPDTSGRIPLADRAGGRQLLDVLACGRIKHLVVAKLDRIARNARDFLNNLQTFDQLGVTLHIVDMGGESLTTSGPYGKFTLTIMAGVAELECELIRARINDIMASKRRNGQLTGSVPYGWDVSQANPNAPKALVPNVTEQAWLQQMLAWRMAGMNYHRIAVQLNTLGVPTKKGRTWDTANVQKVLTNKHTQQWLASLTNPQQQAA